MSDQKRKLRDQDVRGLKYFRKLQPLLARLHGVGAARDVAGNRDLHMDQYCTLILLWLFSPLVDSLRGLQQASELDKVRKQFGVGRSSLGSLSESVTIFDPQPLKTIAEERSHELPALEANRFDVVGQRLTAARMGLLRSKNPAQRMSTQLVDGFSLRGEPIPLGCGGAQTTGRDGRVPPRPAKFQNDSNQEQYTVELKNTAY